MIPAVNPAKYLSYRYMNPRGKSNEAYNRAQELLRAQRDKAISDFERKFK